MSLLPAFIGFAVAVGEPPTGSPVPVPLAVAGQRLPVRADGLTGVAVAGGGPAADPLATDGATTLLFAGELYDRDRLVRALGGETGSDTELVLACLRRYGLSTFRLLNGRFAALLTTPQRTVVATDHAGSVPLYLRRTPSGVEVATEAKALARGPYRADEVPGTAAVPGAVGLRRVRAGRVVILDRASAGRPAAGHAWRTWTPADGRQLMEPDAAVAALAERLDAAVRDRVGDGGPVTVVLSGGVDSSAVTALATARADAVATVALGTDAGDEFAAARLVADHLGTDHTELKMPAVDLVAELPWAVAAAEIVDPDVLEYLLPLVALYRRLPGGPHRVLTGYGADIPLGGMHRTTEPLETLDAMIAADMDGFDGLNELSPVLAGVAGHWTTHPYWDREVLGLLVGLEPGLKRRHGRDKWVLREAMAGRLPSATVGRPKLGIHEGSGLTSSWTLQLRDAGVPVDEVPQTKRAMARRLYDAVVLGGTAPQDLPVAEVLVATARAQGTSR